jgi:Beta-propeller repeat
MSIKQIKSLVQFARASSLVWEAMTIAIPDGVAVFSLDDGAFKIGDGVTMYSNLPTLFTYDDMITAQTGVTTLFKDLVVADDDKLVLVSLDTETSKLYYALSTYTLGDVLGAIITLETKDGDHTTAIASIMAKALSIDAGINTAPNDNIIVINSGRFSNSGVSTASLAAQVAAGKTFIPGSRLEDPIFYADINKTNKVDKEKLADNTTYYVDVIGFNNLVVGSVFTLTCQNTNVSITNVSGSLFSVALNNVTSDVKVDVPVVLTASFDDGTGKRLLQKPVSCKVLRQRMMVSVFGGANTDYFFGVATDSKDNIICVGTTKTESLGGATYGDAIIVKYDSEFNVLAQKRYGGSGDDIFARCVVDDNDDIYVCGWTYSEGFGNPTYGSCLIVKYDNDLNLIIRKVMGGVYGDQFNNLCIDLAGNIVCVGNTASEGGGGPLYNQGLIVKYDNNLNLIARKQFGGSGGSENIYGVCVDSTNNIYLVGNTFSEGTAGDALIMKFDGALNNLAKRRIGGTGYDEFRDVCIDGIGEIYAIGHTSSEGTGGEGLIVRYDSSLNVISKRRYGGAGYEEFFGCCKAKDGKVYVVGSTDSEGLGVREAVFYKMDGVTILYRKRYGGSGNDFLYTVCSDSYGNPIAVGYTTSYNGTTDSLLMKMLSAIPAGSFATTKFPAMTFSGTGTLTNAVSTLTDAAIAFTQADSGLSVAVSGMSIIRANLTNIKDYLN